MSEDLRPSRRIVFQGLGALGVAAVLAGCGGSEPDGGDSGDGGDGGAGGSRTPTSTGTPGDVLAEVGEVPVGGGIILSGKKIVITQPTEGEFKAYSAICKHQGFDVTRVEEGEIICDVHGSRYDVGTGEVTNPPAPAPLDEVAITVEGDRILAA